MKAVKSVGGFRYTFVDDGKGNYKTGWFQLGDELYHFDEKTGEEHKLTVLEDVKTTCGEQGYKTVECECGEKYTMD